MHPVALITVWALAFLVTHLGISSAPIRPRLVAVLGEQPYRGVYSLVGFATLVPLCVVFARHKHAGAMLWDLRAIAPVRWLTWLLMLAAFVFIVASFLNPNPATAGKPSSDAPHGILKITRHPGFVAFTLFGLAHMLMNGSLGDLIFFATFPALGILGGFHQDRRKLRELGESYRRFMEQTSFLPGAAIWQGRQHWEPSDIPWMPIAVGSPVTVLVVLVHPVLFGGHPLG
jgi:uncharacterized membrane protein